MSDYDSGVVRVAGTVQTSGLSVTPVAGNAITNVPDNVLSTIVTYTAPADKRIAVISTSGTLYAKFELFLNTVLIETRRGGPDRTVVFEFANPLQLSSGDILDVKVIHFDTAHTADFESTVYGG